MTVLPVHTSRCAGHDGGGAFVNIGSDSGKVQDTTILFTSVSASRNVLASDCTGESGGGGGLCVYVGSFKGGPVQFTTIALQTWT